MTDEQKIEQKFQAGWQIALLKAHVYVEKVVDILTYPFRKLSGEPAYLRIK